MLSASNIGVDCNCIGFYLVVEDTKVVIGWDTYDLSQVGIIGCCFTVVDGGYCHCAGSGGWILIATKLFH